MTTPRLAALRAVAVRALAGAGVGVLAVWRSWHESGLDARAVAVVLVAMAAVGVALAVLQRALPRPGSVPALIGVALFAVYCCVPETGQIPQVAVAVVVLVAVEVAVDRPLPWPVLLAVVGLVLWSGLFGASGRDSALAGTVFSLWPLLVPAAVVGSSRRLTTAAAPATTLAVVAVASIAAVAVARTGALQPTVTPAFVAVAIAAPASLIVAFAVGRWGDRSSARTDDRRG